MMVVECHPVGSPAGNCCVKSSMLEHAMAHRDVNVIFDCRHSSETPVDGSGRTSAK